MGEQMNGLSIPTVNVVAVSSTGDGTSHATTQGINPNLTVTFISPVVSILIKTVKAFLTSILGLLTAGAVTSHLIPATDFWNLLEKCAGLSVGVAAVAFLGAVVILLGDLEKKFPLSGA